MPGGVNGADHAINGYADVFTQTNRQVNSREHLIQTAVRQDRSSVEHDQMVGQLRDIVR